MNLTKLLALLFCCILCSCTPYLYLNTPPNMPLAGDKGEFKGNVYFGGEGAGVQASYAVDSHYVVLLDFAGQNAQTGTATLNNVTYNSNVSNFQGDIGGGYYQKIGQFGRLEFLGGIGFGAVNTQDLVFNSILPPDYTLDNVNGGFFHIFAQSDIGLVKKNFEFGFGVRLSNITTTASYEADEITGNNSKSVQYYQSLNGDALFVEPSLMFAVGWRKFKFNASAGFSGKLFGQDINQQYGSIYQSFALNFGVTFNFNRKL